MSSLKKTGSVLSICIAVFFVCILFICCNQNVYANDKEEKSKVRGRVTLFPLPRFVSLKGEQTYMRSGPGKDYALLWVYQKKGLPIEIIDEYEQWRRVRDLDGSEGWIHQSVLSGKRTVITLDGTHNVYKEPDSHSDVTAIIESGMIALSKECTDYYCLISHPKFSGWVDKNALYGVDDTEK